MKQESAERGGGGTPGRGERFFSAVFYIQNIRLRISNHSKRACSLAGEQSLLGVRKSPSPIKASHKIPPDPEDKRYITERCSPPKLPPNNLASFLNGRSGMGTHLLNVIKLYASYSSR